MSTSDESWGEVAHSLKAMGLQKACAAPPCARRVPAPTSLHAAFACAALLLLLSITSPAHAQTPAPVTLENFAAMPAGKAPGASPQVQALVKRMGRGINFGNMLESPREGDWGLKVEDEFIRLVGKGGIAQSVRLPVRWSNHASADAQAVIDAAFFARVESTVKRLLERDVIVILNMHHYRQLDGDALDPNEQAVPPDVVQVRLLSMWRQIAQRFSGYDERLIFEVYNEPHGALTAHWNDLFSRAVRVIRESNPTRAIVVGPTEWNSARALPTLVLPPDANLILTVHNYEPFAFTHQGAAWVSPVLPVGMQCCNAKQRRVVTQLLDQAVREAKRLGYPIFVGEFGAYSKAPTESRVRYSRFLRDSMEQRALPWFYWELASGFGVYDPAAKRFRTGLYEALYGN